jgi:hypothetical protein
MKEYCFEVMIVLTGKLENRININNSLEKSNNSLFLLSSFFFLLSSFCFSISSFLILALFFLEIYHHNLLFFYPLITFRISLYILYLVTFLVCAFSFFLELYPALLFRFQSQMSELLFLFLPIRIIYPRFPNLLSQKGYYLFTQRKCC